MRGFGDSVLLPSFDEAEANLICSNGPSAINFIVSNTGGGNYRGLEDVCMKIFDTSDSSSTRMAPYTAAKVGSSLMNSGKTGYEKVWMLVGREGVSLSEASWMVLRLKFQSMMTRPLTGDGKYIETSSDDSSGCKIDETSFVTNT